MTSSWNCVNIVHWFRWWLVAWRRQAITWTKAELLSIGPFQWNLNQISKFSVIKMQLKMPASKWLSFCPGGDELRFLPNLCMLHHGINSWLIVDLFSFYINNSWGPCSFTVIFLVILESLGKIDWYHKKPKHYRMCSSFDVLWLYQNCHFRRKPLATKLGGFVLEFSQQIYVCFHWFIQQSMLHFLRKTGSEVTV